MAEVYAIDQQGGKSNAGYAEDVMMTILSDSHGTPHGVCYALEGNGSRPSHGGNGYSETGQMYTLNTIEQHGVCYIIDANASNSMKSSNPHSGIHESEVTKCLDTTCLNPQCNQGGVLILYHNVQTSACALRATSLTGTQARTGKGGQSDTPTR